MVVPGLRACSYLLDIRRHFYTANWWIDRTGGNNALFKIVFQEGEPPSFAFTNSGLRNGQEFCATRVFLSFQQRMWSLSKHYLWATVILLLWLAFFSDESLALLWIAAHVVSSPPSMTQQSRWFPQDRTIYALNANESSCTSYATSGQESIV